MRSLFHFPQLYDVPLSFLYFVAGAPAVPAEVGGSGRTGRLGWKRASLPRPLGIEVLKGGGLRALLGGKKGALWRETPFCASACRMTSSGGCCVAISVTLRRLAVQQTHFAHGRDEAMRPRRDPGGLPSVHAERPAFLLHVWQVSVRSHPSPVQGVRQNWRKASSGAPVAER